MRPLALVLCGSRRINKRIARFAESLRSSGFDPVLAAFPRLHEWEISSIEDPNLAGTPGFATVRSTDHRPRRFQRPGLIVCMHWSLLPLAVVLKLGFRVPLIYDEHDHYELLAFEASGPPWANRVRSRVIGLVHAWFLPRTDLVTCIRLAGGQLTQSLEARAPTVIELHNYPSHRWVAEPSDRRPSGDSIAIVYVGGIWAEKGCGLMLDAYLQLADDPSPPTLTLHAFGSGDPQIERRLAAAAGTTFHGLTPSAEIVGFLAEHDCLGLVLLDATARYSLVSTNCHKVYEYLAAGVPVLATDVGELAEIVAAADGGWTIPGFDAEELADAIRGIVAQPHDVRRHGAAAAAAMDRDGLWWDAEWAKVEATGVLARSRGSARGLAMFELEVDDAALPADALPADAQAAFGQSRSHLAAFSLTPWKEHCTECAMPACYATCDLYAPRRDGKCRRFVHGIEVIPLPAHPQGYVAKVTFKRWGQLMAYASARLIPVDQAVAIERRVRRVESVAAAWPGSSVSVAGRRGIPSRLAGRWKQQISDGAGQPVDGAPDCLLVEVFHPTSTAATLSLSVANPGQPPFQARLELQPGFQAIEVPVGPMRDHVDLSAELLISLDPNITQPDDEGLTLFFGLVAFIQRVVDPSPVRVAVWDLDNTLWSGTLLEHGIDGITLRDDAIAVVHALDERGVVNSVLSKNHPQDGIAALEHFGITELFAFPTIGWGDKGTLMSELVRRFDLDVHTFALIDDDAFERAQTEASNPGLRTYDSSDVTRLLGLAEFDPVRSREASNRRQHYVAEAQRTEAHAAVGGDYLSFLATCDLRVDIRHPDGADRDRIHELVQRTNQLNYSGVHHARTEANAMIDDPANECFVVSCIDVFGDYGTVGFLVVDREQECLTDAMFSCRVHFKHIEHAALSFLLHRSRNRGALHFDARFRATDRNADAASVFDDLGFLEVDRHGNDRRYRFDLADPIPREDIVSITYEGVAWEP